MNVGRPGRGRRKNTLAGAFIEDWSRCVRNMTVSSKEGQMARLIDNNPNTYWQSSGSQGKVYVCYITNPCVLCVCEVGRV